jgi:hypothetical protein
MGLLDQIIPDPRIGCAFPLKDETAVEIGVHNELRDSLSDPEKGTSHTGVDGTCKKTVDPVDPV